MLALSAIASTTAPAPGDRRYAANAAANACSCRPADISTSDSETSGVAHVAFCWAALV